MHGLEHPFEITEYITVPDEAGFDLLELIFPYPTRVVVLPSAHRLVCWRHRLHGLQRGDVQWAVSYNS
jgi:hypothetical protein